MGNVVMLEDWTSDDPLVRENRRMRQDAATMAREIVRLREIERKAFEVMQHVNTGEVDAHGAKACYAMVELGRVLDFPVHASILADGRAKRQAVLDLLNARGPMPYRDIRAALNEGDGLSTLLAVMKQRGELGQTVLGKRNFLWRALVKHSALKTMGPAPEPEASPEPPRPRHVRVVRLLDKPASQTGRGGQCAISSHGSLQCHLGERGLLL